MIKILILGTAVKDNEAIAAAIIGGVELPVNILSVYDSTELFPLLESGEKIDLFLLKVNARPEGGYVAARKIRERAGYEAVPILFVTTEPASQIASHELATYAAIKRRNYISLPVDRLDVQSKVNLYLDEILTAKTEAGDRQFLYLEHDGGEVLLLKEDILFAEISCKRCTLHTVGGVYEIGRMPLQQLIARIGDENFIRCHKSFGVNVARIEKILRLNSRLWSSRIGDGEGCLISATYIEDVRRKYRALEKRGR